MTGWVDKLADNMVKERPSVLVTLVSIEGSSPREPGAKMIVTENAVSGTLGGGTVELIAQRTARGMLEAGPGAAAPRLESFTLSDELDQACGGRMQVLFEPVWPEPFHIAIFGAGHVGRALARVLAEVPCRLRLIDARAEMFDEPLPDNVAPTRVDRPVDAVGELPAGSYVLAMTHSHDLDLDIVEAALRRGDMAFVGTIGSKTKRGRFRSRLAERGLDEATVDRLAIPIGVPGVGGKRPSEIAIAVAAQLLQLREAASTGATGR